VTSSEVSYHNKYTAYNTEKLDLNLHRLEKLKSHNKMLFSVKEHNPVSYSTS